MCVGVCRCVRRCVCCGRLFGLLRWEETNDDVPVVTRSRRETDDVETNCARRNAAEDEFVQCHSGVREFVCVCSIFVRRS